MKDSGGGAEHRSNRKTIPERCSQEGLGAGLPIAERSVANWTPTERRGNGVTPKGRALGPERSEERRWRVAGETGGNWDSGGFILVRASELSVSALNAGPLWEQPKTISGIIAGRARTKTRRDKDRIRWKLPTSQSTD